MKRRKETGDRRRSDRSSRGRKILHEARRTQK